jgi:predicted TPR repeat methyltransferase
MEVFQAACLLCAFALCSGFRIFPQIPMRGSHSLTMSSQSDTMIKQLRLKIAQEPQNEPAIFNLALLLSEKIDMKIEALTQFMEAAEINPKRDATWFKIGNLLEDLGDTQSAIDSYERAINVTASKEVSSAAYNAIFNIHFAAQSLDLAAKVTDRAVESNPEDDIAWCSMGIVLRENRNYDLSKMCFTRAIAISDNSPLAFSNLGFLYTQLGRTEDAISAYKKAIDLDAHDEASLYSLSMLYIESGQNTVAYQSAAVPYLQQCLKINPKNVKAQYALASMFGETSTHLFDFAPVEYLQPLFDSLAKEDYDAYIIDDLRYRGFDNVWEAFVNSIFNREDNQSTYDSQSSDEATDLGADDSNIDVNELQLNINVNTMSRNTEDMVIAELGVGSGIVSFGMRNFGYHGKIIGCDISEGMAELASKRTYTTDDNVGKIKVGLSLGNDGESTPVSGTEEAGSIPNEALDGQKMSQGAVDDYLVRKEKKMVYEVMCQSEAVEFLKFVPEILQTHPDLQSNAGPDTSSEDDKSVPFFDVSPESVMENSEPVSHLDSIIAADLVPYIGKLEPLLTTAHSVLKSEGTFIFTSQELSDEVVNTLEYMLTPRGLYEHRRSYIDKMAVKAGFVVERCEERVQRAENGQPIFALVYTLRKTQ